MLVFSDLYCSVSFVAPAYVLHKMRLATVTSSCRGFFSTLLPVHYLLLLATVRHCCVLLIFFFFFCSDMFLQQPPAFPFRLTLLRWHDYTKVYPVATAGAPLGVGE